jgi:hypothetical protein
VAFRSLVDVLDIELTGYAGLGWWVLGSGMRLALKGVIRPPSFICSGSETLIELLARYARYLSICRDVPSDKEFSHRLTQALAAMLRYLVSLNDRLEQCKESKRALLSPFLQLLVAHHLDRSRWILACDPDIRLSVGFREECRLHRR